eukprot:6201213-Pleurochrysis_carterae.AAC.1
METGGVNAEQQTAANHLLPVVRLERLVAQRHNHRHHALEGVHLLAQQRQHRVCGQALVALRHHLGVLLHRVFHLLGVERLKRRRRPLVGQLAPVVQALPHGLLKPQVRLQVLNLVVPRHRYLEHLLVLRVADRGGLELVEVGVEAFEQRQRIDHLSRAVEERLILRRGEKLRRASPQLRDGGLDVLGELRRALLLARLALRDEVGELRQHRLHHLHRGGVGVGHGDGVLAHQRVHGVDAGAALAKLLLPLVGLVQKVGVLDKSGNVHWRGLQPLLRLRRLVEELGGEVGRELRQVSVDVIEAALWRGHEDGADAVVVGLEDTDGLGLGDGVEHAFFLAEAVHEGPPLLQGGLGVVGGVEARVAEVDLLGRLEDAAVLEHLEHVALKGAFDS